jgi:hypothetical protein
VAGAVRYPPRPHRGPRVGAREGQAPHNVSTPDETFELRAELKEFKEAVFVDESGTNAMGDKPVGLTRAYLDTGNRRVIPEDVINKFAEEAEEASKEEDDVKRVVNTVNTTSLKEGDPNATSSKAKSAKLAKLVKLAKSTALWCLSPYIPLLQEAKDKQRKVCPVNLRGEVCTVNNCGSKHPKVCPVADHGKGKIPKATCALRHMQVPFAGKLPTAARGTTATMPGRPSRTSTSSSSRRSTVPRSSRQGSGRRR